MRGSECRSRRTAVSSSLSLDVDQTADLFCGFPHLFTALQISAFRESRDRRRDPNRANHGVFLIADRGSQATNAFPIFAVVRCITRFLISVQAAASPFMLMIFFCVGFQGLVAEDGLKVRLREIRR